MENMARALLHEALRVAPRRFRMPPLPVDAVGAEAAGPETGIAFAMEAMRRARQAGDTPAEGLQDLFTRQLAELVRVALTPGGGDPAFQALVLRSQEPEVEEYVRLLAQAPVDRRVVRTAVDAVAHPGKLRGMVDEPVRDALGRLHALSKAHAWSQLREGMGALGSRLRGNDEGTSGTDEGRTENDEGRSGNGEGRSGDDEGRSGNDEWLGALQRLERGDALLQSPAVQRYRALRERGGPGAGSEAALASGRASARTGDAAEAVTVDALRDVARLLNAREAGWRVLRGLRTPRGFPGAVGKAKDEWDAALVYDRQGAAEIELLAEVKSSPAAATPDFTRLARGLGRLADAGREGDWEFPTADGAVRVAGESLRRLQPRGHVLPPHVIYACSAEPESRTPVLSAASKAVLLAEPASLACARALTGGAAPAHLSLAVVWEDLATAPRLRSALHQYDTARAVREAMLHPRDLLAAVDAISSSRP